MLTTCLTSCHEVRQRCRGLDDAAPEGGLLTSSDAMPKPDTERGYIGAWMRKERRAKGWTIADVVTALVELDPDNKVREDYIRYLEAGPRKPGPVLLAALCRIYGSEPVPFEEEPGAEVSIIAALEQLTEEVRGLRAELREASRTIAGPSG